MYHDNVTKKNRKYILYLLPYFLFLICPSSVVSRQFYRKPLSLFFILRKINTPQFLEVFVEMSFFCKGYYNLLSLWTKWDNFRIWFSYSRVEIVIWVRSNNNITGIEFIKLWFTTIHINRWCYPITWQQLFVIEYSSEYNFHSATIFRLESCIFCP